MKTPGRNKRATTQAQAISRQEAQEIADAVIQARKRTGMTQAETAREMGITQSSYARLESSATLPSMNTLQRFARATSSRLHLSIDSVSDHDIRTASHAMTDTLNRPTFSTDRRGFLGGAMGLAGMLGLGSSRRITAQEATAASTEQDSFNWDPPEWGEEPAQFEVLQRNNEVTLVRTIDGEIEVPQNPQRVVSLDAEYISLFELGIVTPISGIGIWGEEPLLNNGELTADLHHAFEKVPTLDLSEPDVEEIIIIEPDLILGSTLNRSEEDYAVFSGVAPCIRTAGYATDVPRAAIRDFGALFSLEDAATQLIADHDDYIQRAQAIVGAIIADKRTATIYPASETEFVTYPYYSIQDGRVSAVDWTYPFFRELGMTPTHFIESLAEQDNRETMFYWISLEEFGLIDADYVIVGTMSSSQFDTFMANPAVQASNAYRNNTILHWDTTSHGRGLAGVRSSVKWIVETLTGESFE